MIITIDGPAGSGKSTAARVLAERLGFQFLDTGAMYRVVTLVCQREQIELSRQAIVAARAESIHIQFDGHKVLADGVDVTDAIRTVDVTQGTHFVAVNHTVRELLGTLQRRAASGRDIVTEGRDQGTVVFPEAECKFFLTASPEERARRRQHDLERRGEHLSLSEILAQQTARDRRDEERAVAPLKPSPVAIRIDTSHRSVEDVVGQLEGVVRQRIPIC
ncbi:MAG: cytidylate kinase [Planctomycetaceae bacterium]|nr:cytidylate kinase [Planctomycetaceae bacterium]